MSSSPEQVSPVTEINVDLTLPEFIEVYDTVSQSDDPSPIKANVVQKMSSHKHFREAEALRQGV